MYKYAMRIAITLIYLLLASCNSVSDLPNAESWLYVADCIIIPSNDSGSACLPLHKFEIGQSANYHQMFEPHSVLRITDHQMDSLKLIYDQQAVSPYSKSYTLTIEIVRGGSKRVESYIFAPDKSIGSIELDCLHSWLSYLPELVKKSSEGSYEHDDKDIHIYKFQFDDHFRIDTVYTAHHLNFNICKC